MTLRARLAVATCALVLGSGLTLHAQQEDRVAALVGLARVKRDAGDLSAARRYFEDAQRLRTLGTGELMEYFWVLAGQAPGRSLDVGDLILSTAPASHHVRDRMIAAALAIGDDARVVALATAGERLQPRTARWARRLGESYLRRGVGPEAVAAYRRAADAGDGDGHDMAGLALAFGLVRDYTAAAATWSRVPAPLLAERADWTASRLRALALGAAPDVAAPALEAWLEAHPDDDVARELLVELWARAGRPDRAMEAIGPLTSGPDAVPWLRRKIELARGAGDTARALDSSESLLQTGRATPAEQWALADLLVSSSLFDRAAVVAAEAAGPDGCDGRLFLLLDRIPAPLGTSLTLDALTTRGCEEPRWLARGIERAVASARHAEALELMRRLPAASASTLPMRRLAGQLQLWTGDVSGAIDVLESVLRDQPGEIAGREALVDAYRSNGATYAAWDAAEPLTFRSSVTLERLLSFAELALEADRPDRSISMVERLLEAAPTSATSNTSVPGIAAAASMLLGRAQLAQGQPADAWRTLSALPEAEIGPQGALALLDSTILMHGRAAALPLATRLVRDTPAWREVLLRRVTITSVAGEHEQAARLRATLDQLDPVLAAYAAAETALAEERPLDALAVLDRLLPGDTTPRTLDLRAVALAGTGHLAEAADLVATLARQRPRFVPFAVRQAELAWRMTPTADTLGRVLYLPARFPGNQDAAVAAARVLASEERHAEAIAVLGSLDEAVELSLEARLVWAESLHATGRSSGALALVGEVQDLTGSAAILRAQVSAAVHGPQQASAMFRDLAKHRGATADLFMAWAELHQPPADRLDMLESAAAKFPAHAGLHATLAASRLAAGEEDGARLAAERAVALDPHHGGAWFLLIDATAATQSRGGLDLMLARFAASAESNPALVIGMAERMGSIARGPGDPLLARAIEWLEAVDVGDTTRLARDLARVRVLAAAERWDEALAAADATVDRHHHRSSTLKLRAEVLSWSGRHRAAIDAYDTYLGTAPDDIAARRQRARVAGWGGHFAEARRLYTNLRAAFPGHAAIAAESDAKVAFYGGRWSAAARAYARWLALEPDNGEARFEMAEALRAWGHVEQADATLEALESATGHRLAAAARERVTMNRQPAVTLIARERDAEGYEGRRQLTIRQQGGSFAAGLGTSGRTLLFSEGTSVLAQGADVDRRGYRLGVGGIRRMRPSLQLEGRAAWWDFGRAHTGTPQLLLRADWRTADRWTWSGGFERELILENIVTIDRSLAATGAFVGGHMQSPNGSLDVRTAWQALSDGNRRQRTTVSASRALGERLSHVRAVAWAEALNYRRTSTAYFAPPRFLRIDAGLEYTHRFSQPRFQGDRVGEIVGSYLAGTDDRGTRYQQPSVRLAVELTPGLIVDAHAGWIRSGTYNERSISIGLRLTGSGSGH